VALERLAKGLDPIAPDRHPRGGPVAPVALEVLGRGVQGGQQIEARDAPRRPRALVTFEPDGAITADLRRASYDPLPMAEEVAARGLPGDVYRAATIRTGRFVR